MKSKSSFVIIPLLLTLVACALISTPTLANIPNPTELATSIPLLEETVSQSNIPTNIPFVHERASDDCFLTIGFIPGKTGMAKVISVWGFPSSKSFLGSEYEYWSFDFVGIPTINFKDQVIDVVEFSLKNCSLKKIVSKLGPPEKVEVTVFISCIDLSASYRQDFHFTSLGFAYSRYCDETQNCFVFQGNDIVDGKEFYSPNKTVEDSMGFNMASYVYDWHGFDVDVEKIENKIEDFVTVTPTP